MKRLNYRRIFAFTGLFSLFFVYILLWVRMIQDPGQRTGSDFSGLYTYARIYQLKGVAYINDFEEQKKLQEHLVGHQVVPIIYTHLPMNAPLVSIIVNEDYVGSFKRWAIVLILINVLNVFLLTNLIEPKYFSRENLIVLCASSFLFFPTFSGFMNGREDAFYLFGIILWAWAIFSRKYFLAGLYLSFTVIRPQIALVFALPFLFRHRNVFLGFILGASIFAGINLALVGFNGAIKYLDSVRYIEDTVWYEPHSLDMPTISGIVRRNFVLTNIELARNFVWVSYALGIGFFSYIWYRSIEINERHIGLLTLAAIFFVPYAHYHDLILLLIPIFCLIRFLQKQSVDQYYLSIGPLIVSILAAIGFAGSGWMKFPIIYFIMLVLAYLLSGSDKLFHRPALQTS